MPPRAKPTSAQPLSWLLLIHQLPPQPAYLRVKVGRRLQGLGAVALKNSVYALPARTDAREDFEWVLREITAGGGDGSVIEAKLVEGLTDDAVKALFVAAREGDYAELAEEARSLLGSAQRVDQKGRSPLLAAAERLKKRLAEVAGIDFFDAPGRGSVEGLLASIDARLTQTRAESRERKVRLARAEYRGRVWVTRKGIHVDRMASAWLIRRFLDPKAQLKFVDGRDYPPRKGELRFDMFGGEFTHEGELCTFEVLLERFQVADPALRAIGEIIHDIDLKESRFARAETGGVASLVAGIAMQHEGDAARLEAAHVLFDGLHTFFTRKGRSGGQEKKS